MSAPSIHPDSDLRELLEHGSWARALAGSLVHDPTDADDAVQEAFVVALASPPRHGGNLRAWLAEVVRNCIRHQRRGRARRSRVESTHADLRARSENSTATATDDLVARTAQHRDLTDRVLQLDPPLREVVLLRFFEGLPPRDIATRLGIPVETVRTRLRRALGRLRGVLDRTDSDWQAAWLATGLAPSGLVGTALTGSAADSLTSTAPRIGAWNWKGLVLMNSMRTAAITGSAALVLAVTGWLLWPLLSGSPDNPLNDRATEQVAGSGEPLRADPSVDPAASAGTRGTTRRTPVPAGERRSARDEAAADSSAPDGESTDAATDGAAKRRIIGRVLSPTGDPLPGVRVHFARRSGVRFADSIDTWLGDGENSVRVADDLLARLRDDEQFAAEFFERFADPADWRAALLAEVAPGRGTRTDAEGRFVIELGAGAPPEGRPTVIEPGMTVVARGRVPVEEDPAADGATSETADEATTADETEPNETAKAGELEHVLIATDSIGVAGVVKDRSGAVVRDARVAWRLPARQATDDPLHGVQWQQRAIPPAFRTGSDGRFLLRDAPVLPGALLIARHPERGRAKQPVPRTTRSDIELRLDAPVVDPATATLTVRVLAPDDTPVGGARVLFDSVQSRTDETGHATIEVPTDATDRKLFVTARGYQPLQVAGFGARVRELARSGGRVDLRLDGPALQIRGRVVDANGAPIAGAELNAYDGAQPDTTFSNLAMLVDGRRNVTTAEDGSFVLGGLSARSYRLRIWRLADRRIHVSEPLRAGDSAAVIRLPEHDLVPRALGQVLDARGEPVPNARVSVGFTTWERPGGGWLGHNAPAVACDEQGRFELEGLPRRHVFLEVQGAGLFPARFPIEGLEPSAPRLVVDRACRVRIRIPANHPGDTIEFLDPATGTALGLISLQDGRDSTRALRRDPELEVLAAEVPERAGSVRLLLDGVEIARRPVRLDPNRELLIELP